MKIMGIETSCDDTTAGILVDEKIVASEVLTQHEFHADFGGIVPEIASRQHLLTIPEAVERALKTSGLALEEIDVFAATYRPGLLGALLVGLSYAKGLAYALGKPFVPVDHIMAHIAVAMLGETPEFPAVALVVSGGHTSLFVLDSRTEARLLGETVDDAAGEVFDKISRHMGLGWPGGPVLDKLSKKAVSRNVKFTSPLIKEESFRFSFSGLKTAAMLYIDRNPSTPPEEVAFGLTSAIVEVLLSRALLAIEKTGARSFILAGGVAANSMLRSSLEVELSNKGIKLYMPPVKLCMDNGVMVAAMARNLVLADGMSRYEAPHYFNVDAVAS